MMEEKDAFTLMIDSGVGGLSVLAMLKMSMPNENVCFYADAGNAPYGDKSPEEVRTLLDNIIESTRDKKVKAILLACNTATSAGAALLRKKLTIPVIGMEPALKPAVMQKQGQIVVMATRLTIREEKFRNLLAQFSEGRDIVPLSCPGLMELVEKDPSGCETEEYLHQLLDPYQNTASAFVLGCTHYVFLRPLLQKLYPGIKLFDGNEGVTRHLGDILKQQNIDGGTGAIEIRCSIRDDFQRQQYIQKCEAMLKFCSEMYQQTISS